MATLRSGSLSKVFYLVFMLGIFVIDYLTPPAFAVWLLYVIPVLLVAVSGTKADRLTVAAVGTSLIVIAAIVATGHDPLDLLNRGIGIALVWSVATFMRTAGQAGTAQTSKGEWLALRVVLVYVAVAGLWITLSDSTLARFVQDRELLLRLSETKGWVFVLTTGVLLYVMLRRSVALRMNIEAALAQSEELFRTSFTSAPNGMALMQKDGTFIRVNSSLTEMLAYSERGLLSRTLSMIIPPGNTPSARDILDKSSQGRFTSDLQLVKGNGSYIWCEISGAAVKNREGSTEYIVLQVLDASERMRSHQALRESEAYYRSLFHQSPIPMWLYDPQTLRFLDVNESAVNHYGYSRDEFLNMTIKDIRPPEDVELLLASFKTKHQEETETTYWRHTKKDGTVINVAIMSRNFPYGDGMVRLVHANDITERIEATEQRNQMFQLSSDIIVVAGFDGYVKQTNPALQSLLGWTIDDLKTRPWPDLVHPADLERSRAINKVLAEGKPVNDFENRVLCKDGSFRWMSWNAIAAPGKSVIYAAGRDVTTQRESVKAIMESEARYRRIIETANEGIWLLDEDGNTTFVNKTLAGMLGYSVEEIAGKPFEAFLREEDRNIARQRLEDRRKGKKEVYEFRFVRKDGSVLWVLISSTGITNTDGSYAGALKMVVDISKRRSAEDALRASEKRYRAIIETQGDAVCRWLPDTTLTFTNVQYRKLFNIPENHPSSLQWISFIPEHEREAVRSFYAELAENPQPVSYEHTVLLADGSHRWYVWQDIPLFDEKGKVVEFQSVGRDITERRQTDVALRESEERLRLALYAANQGLYDLNVQTGEAKVSEEYVTMLGYDPATFHETNAAWIERLHPDDREETARVYRDYIEGKIPEYRVEFRQRTKSGDWKWILSIGKVVEHDDAGNPVRMLGTHTDITGRRLAEEALRDSEERFRNLLESIEDVAWSSTLDGGSMLYMNRAAERLYGRSLSEFSENPGLWLDVVHPEDRQVAEQSSTNLFAKGASQAEYRIIRPDGSVRWILDRKRVISNRKGERERLGGLAIDITTRKQYEERQRQMADETARLLHRLQLTFERTPVGFVVCDPEFRIVEWNPACERIFGYTKEEILNREAFDLVVPESSHDAVSKMFQQIRSTNETIELVNENITKDGRTIFCRWHNTGLFDADGNFIGLLAMSQDITEQRRAEEHIRYQASLLEDVSDSIISTDQEFRIRTWNSAAERMYGFSAGEVIGKLMPEVIQTIYTTGTQDEVMQQFLNSGTWNGEVTQIGADERHVNVLSSVTLLRDAQGNPTGAVAVNRDITERRKAEEELRRRLHYVTILHEAGILLSERHTISEAAEVVLDSLAKLLSWQRGSVWTYDPQTGIMNLVAHSDMGLRGNELQHELARVRSMVIRVGEGITGWVALNGQPVRTGDVTSDPRYLCADERTKSELCVPLRVGGRVIGAVNVESHEPDAFDENDEVLLSTLASQAAIAVENAQLLEDLKKELDDRRQAEEALRVSEARYRNLAENFPNGVVNTYDRDLRVTYVGGSDMKKHNVRSEDFVGKTVYEIAPPETCEIAVPNFRRAFEGDVVSYEAPFSDGRSYFVTVAPLVSPDGSINEIHVVSQNITEQKLAREKLLAQAETIRQLLLTTSDGYILADTDSKIIDVNPAYCKMVGYTRDELLDIKVAELEASLTPEQVADRVEHILREGYARFETCHRHRDGSSVELDVSITILRENGTPLVAAFVRDITERKRYENELRKLNRVYAVTTQTTQAIVRAKSRESLLESLCTIAVQYGTFRLAWVGLVDGSSGELVPVAYAGDERGFIAAMKRGERGLNQKHGPASAAIRQGKSVICNDIEHDTMMNELWDECRARGYRSVMSLPIIVNRNIEGAFTLFASEPGFFSADEVATLEDMAASISFALEALDHEKWRTRAEDELRKSEENLRRLSGYLQNVREEERKRIAREIHDELGQQLTALKIEASLLQRHCTKYDKIIDSTPLLEHTTTLSSIAEMTILTLRRIAAELRPSVLDKLGLIDAMQWHAKEFQDRIGIRCEIHTTLSNSDISEEVATALFRIFQEALTNVARHANATKVEAKLEQRGEFFDLQIQDNGRGIRPDEIADSKSLGLLGIFERAKLLGGTARINGSHRSGTRLEIKIPVSTQKHHQ